MIEDIDDTSLSYELFLAENGHHTVWICPSWLQVHELLKETEAAPIWVESFFHFDKKDGCVSVGLAESFRDWAGIDRVIVDARDGGIWVKELAPRIESAKHVIILHDYDDEESFVYDDYDDYEEFAL